MLAELDDKPGRVVLVDLGGGVLTVARGDDSQIDALVVVAEPYPRSTEVARRLLAMAEDKHINRRLVVANKIADDADVAFVRDALGVEPDIVISQDDGLVAADRVGASPLDHHPTPASIDRLRELAGALLI